MPIDHDAVIAREGTALAHAAEGNLDAAVPETDWTVADLIDHTGSLTRFWAGRLRSANGGDFYDLERPADADPVAWYRDGLGILRAELAAADPDIAVKTWAGPLLPSWLWRRMAQEFAVHRWDAEAAAGDAELIEPELAADGIDEFFEVFCALADLSEPVGTLHLHATDSGPDGIAGEWFVDARGGGFTWERAHAKADVAVRASTSELLLVLWGRVPADAVEVLGDGDVLARWRDKTTF
jgi:uncharacterized protein (TIGR03083 family)